MADQQVQEFFNQESDTYQKGVKKGGEEKLSLIKKYASNGDSLLDIGCGSGAFLQQVSDQSPIEDVVGIDIAPEMLSDSTADAGDYAVANARMLPFKDSSFDFVHADTVIHHIVGATWKESKQYAKQLLEDVNRILTEGGYFLITERIQKARLISDEVLSWIIFRVLRDGAVLAKPFHQNARAKQPPISFYSEEELFNSLLDADYSILGVDRFSITDLRTLHKLVQTESRRVNIYAVANGQS